MFSITAGNSSYPYYDYLKFRDLQRGVVRVTGSISDNSVQTLASELAIIKESNIPSFTLVLNSPGGGIYSALAMYDHLRRLSSEGHSLTIIVEGMAASAAAMIVLQAADKRQAFKHSRFLIHEARRGVFGYEKMSDMEDEFGEMKNLSDQILAIMASRSHRTEEEIKTSFARKERWMGAEEALEWGLIDEIL